MTLLDGEEYMELLEYRRAEWEAAHPAREAAEAQIAQIKAEFPDANPQIKPKLPPLRPLLEWFILPGDEDLVDMAALERAVAPEPAPKRTPRPRVYRSAASLREERDRVQARMDAVAGRGDCGDVAAINISPSSSKPRIAAAGRRRFAQMDRDLEQYGQLAKRLASLNSRIASAEYREVRAAS